MNYLKIILDVAISLPKIVGMILSIIRIVEKMKAEMRHADLARAIDKMKDAGGKDIEKENKDITGNLP